MPRLARFAWGVLAYDVAVVAWGAFVRATGSGAGCGRHWPTCNGQVFPRSAPLATLIEWSHRLSSGGAMLLTLALAVWAWRRYPRAHRVRRGALASLGLMGAEALIGAALVLFALVAHDASVTRALSISLHLVNTFLLLGTTAVTAYFAAGGAPVRLRGQGTVAALVAAPVGLLLLVGATGAVTALGDTLFPTLSLPVGLAADWAPAAPMLVRLRVVHPLLAMVTAGVVVVALGIVRALRPSRSVLRLSRAAVALVVAQVAAGLLDVVLAAPVGMQLVHLVLADCVWIAVVLSGAAALGVPASAESGQRYPASVRLPELERKGEQEQPPQPSPSYSQRASHVS